MYGDQVTCVSKYTSGHGVDGSDPDNILVRPKLFMYYVKLVTELYPWLSSSAKLNTKNDPVKKIKKIVDWGVKSAKEDGMIMNAKQKLGIGSDFPTSAKLDGIFRFHIALLRAREQQSFEFDLPIKSLPSETEEDLAKIFYSEILDVFYVNDWDFEDAANRQKRVFAAYMDAVYGEFNVTSERKGNKIVFTVKKK